MSCSPFSCQQYKMNGDNLLILGFLEWAEPYQPLFHVQYINRRVIDYECFLLGFFFHPCRYWWLYDCQVGHKLLMECAPSNLRTAKSERGLDA